MEACAGEEVSVSQQLVITIANDNSVQCLATKIIINGIKPLAQWLGIRS
jgi:hypothetical protein